MSQAPVLSAAALTSLAALNEANLPSRATIRRTPAAGTKDGTGTVTVTPTVVGSDVPCRVAPPSAVRELLAGDQRVAANQRLVTFARWTDIQPRDALTIELRDLTGTPTGETLTLEVVGPLGPTDFEVLRSVLCTVKGGTA